MKKLTFNPIALAVNKLKSTKSDPVKVCYGFAFGTFISATPFIGFKWLVALPIVWLAKWNKTACMIGILQVNYLTGPFFYALAYLVGKSVCGFENTFELPDRMTFGAVTDIFFGNAEVFISLLAGGLLLSIPMTLGAFYLARSIFYRRLNPMIS